MPTQQSPSSPDRPRQDLSAPVDSRYPIGGPNRNPVPADRAASLQSIQELPQRFAAAYTGLDAAQLDTPYRDGGWTLRQLAHHLADSHMNAFLRIKFALTEDWPGIQTYNEKLWAETGEVTASGVSVEAPLALLAALHIRMHALLSSFTEAQWQRGYIHPDNGRSTLDQVSALYAWHGRHHTAHAAALRQRKGW
jgi:hypothetical protein